MLPLLQSTCDTVHCLGERALCFLHLGSFFRNFSLQTHQWGHLIFVIDGSSSLKVIDEWNTARIPKDGGQNLTSWHLRFWSRWTVFILFCPLSWLTIWLWSVVMNPSDIFKVSHGGKFGGSTRPTRRTDALNTRRAARCLFSRTDLLIWGNHYPKLGEPLREILRLAVLSQALSLVWGN